MSRASAERNESDLMRRFASIYQCHSRTHHLGQLWRSETPFLVTNRARCLRGEQHDPLKEPHLFIGGYLWDGTYTLKRISHEGKAELYRVFTRPTWGYSGPWWEQAVLENLGRKYGYQLALL